MECVAINVPVSFSDTEVHVSAVLQRLQCWRDGSRGNVATLPLHSRSLEAWKSPQHAQTLPLHVLVGVIEVCCLVKCAAVPVDACRGRSR